MYTGGQFSKLEKLLFDHALTFYKEEATAVKKHKDKLNRQSQPMLFARHHFKIAFYAECRKDSKTAFKYYTSAYAFLKGMLRTCCMDVARMLYTCCMGTYVAWVQQSCPRSSRACARSRR